MTAASMLQQAYLLVNDRTAGDGWSSHTRWRYNGNQIAGTAGRRCLQERPESIKTSQFSCTSATCARADGHGQPWEKSSEMIDDDRWCLPFNPFPTNRNYYLYLRTDARPAYSCRRVIGDVGNSRLTGHRWSFKLPNGIQSHFTDCIIATVTVFSQLPLESKASLNIWIHLVLFCAE